MNKKSIGTLTFAEIKSNSRVLGTQGKRFLEGWKLMVSQNLTSWIFHGREIIELLIPTQLAQYLNLYSLIISILLNSPILLLNAISFILLIYTRR